ncbi:hypothetical protein ELP57_41760, partial [Klebsiella pneumoniae]|nr:hypothetical protein [Klebsiella pneumoniae]
RRQRQMCIRDRWLTTPWTDISGEVGQMDKTTVKFSIPMDNAISLRTVDDNGWFGEVSASGEIHVQATWPVSYTHLRA